MFKKEGKGEAQRAVALRYSPDYPAPFLVAKGGGRTAERLVEIATEAGVPVVREEALASALFPLDLGSYIPEAYYEVVAKVFAFIKTVEAS